MLTRVEGYNYSLYILCMCMWHLSVCAQLRNCMTETEIWLHEWFVKLLLGCMLCGECERHLLSGGCESKFITCSVCVHSKLPCCSRHTGLTISSFHTLHLRTDFILSSESIRAGSKLTHTVLMCTFKSDFIIANTFAVPLKTNKTACIVS